MKKRRLGAAGPEVGEIGLGCWSFAGAYGPTSEAESHATLGRSLELGCDFWDTANVYGHGLSEEVIGRFLKAHPSARVVLATKGGIVRDPKTNARSFDNSDAYLRTTLEGSLKRLGRERVDLYYIHRRDQRVPVEDVMGTLVRFKQEGKIGGIGFSEIAPSTLRRAHAVHPVMAVQSEYSLWSRLPDLGLVQACRDLGVAFVPFSPLGRGMLTGTVHDTAGFGPQDFRRTSPRFLPPSFAANLAAIQPFAALAKAKGATPGQLALAWVLAQGAHLIPIPGTRSPAHLAENAGAGRLALSAGEVAEIESLLPAGFAHGDRYTDDQWIGAERYG